MSIKPIAFFVESSSKIVLKFNKKIKTMSEESFSVKSMDGKEEDLTVSSVSFSGQVAYISTSPQKSGYYYVLQVLDNGTVTSQDDFSVSSVKIERTVFFTGFERFNPIRDSILSRLPRVFLNDKSLIKDIISEQSEQLYKARRSIGELLTDNYIRQEAVDEPRKRGSSPLDRLANENAFKISRVSRYESEYSSKFKTIQYGEGFGERREVIDSTLSLQEEDVEEIIYIRDIKSGIATLSNNIIKLKYAAVTSSGSSTEYDLFNKKYSILENKYDSNFALKNEALEENQIYFDKNFIDNFSLYEDYIVIRYISKNKEIFPSSDISFFQIRTAENEVLKVKSNNFKLSHDNVCDQNGNEIQSGGIVFLNPLDMSNSEYFSNEIPYGSLLPSKKGDYSINYADGEVFVFGDDGNGTPFPVLATYSYKRFLKENIDYYVYDQDLSFNNSRMELNNYGKITFSYDKVFVEGYHYKANVHKEVMPEVVGSNFTSSFSFKTSNYPITNVFRVVNKTTDEIYQVLDFENDEIFISGNNSPRISSKKEFAKFKTTSQKLFPSSVFISKISKIEYNSRGISIDISNAVPSSLFDENTAYYISNGILTIKVTSISYSDGQVESLTLEKPLTSGSNFYIGTKVQKFDLDQVLILDNYGENIGSSFDSSLKINSDLFKKEKFCSWQNNSNEQISVYGSLEEFRLNRNGDYIVDYVNGEIYLCQEESNLVFGNVIYKYALFDTSFSNHMSISECKSLSGEEMSHFSKEDDGFLIKDIRSNFDYFDESKYSDIDESSYPLEVNSDYEVGLLYPASSIKGVFLKDDVFGKGLISDGKSYVQEKSEILNYNLKSKIDFKNNLIDFKKRSVSSFYSDGEYIRIEPKASDFGSFYSLEGNDVLIKSDKVLIKSQILYRKISGSTIFVSNFEIFSNINTNHDKVLIGESYYDILSFSVISSSIVIDYSGSISGDLYLIQQGSETDGVLSFHSSSGLKTNLQYTFNYIPNDAPVVGSAMVVWYNSGKIKCEYNYVADTIQVYYEYGDNEIEWTQNGLKEGEDYFVTYEYGALREALRLNFGLLSNIDYFTVFSLSTDRETYRDALEASISSSSEGSTKSAISNIVKSISKTAPDILEGSPKGWILGRDYVRTPDFEYTGNMTWGPVRYESGLFFDKNTLSVGSKNTLSVDEGTVSFWARNDWSKLENDADLKIVIDEFSHENYFYNTDPNILEVLGPIQSHGVSFGNSIFIEQENSGIRYNFKNISPADETKVSFKLGINIFDKLKTNNLAKLEISDGYYKAKINFNISREEPVSYSKIERDFVASYSILEYYKKTVFSGTYKSMGAESSLVRITLSQPISNIDELNTFLITDEGYILEILYGDNKTIIARQAPINWDMKKFDRSVSTYSLSGLRFAKFSIDINNVTAGKFNFVSERINISLDRENNLIKVNNFEGLMHRSARSAKKSVDFYSLCNSSISIDRLSIENSPYFNKDNLFIGKSAKNPKSSSFSISSYDHGIPLKTKPGIYFYTQTNDDFLYDDNAERYWVVDIIKNETLDVPAGVIAGETVFASIPHSFSAEVKIESESNIYSIDKYGSIEIKKTNFELEEDGLFQIEKESRDLDNVVVLDAKTTKYHVHKSYGSSFENMNLSALNSSSRSIQASFEIPETSSFSTISFKVSIENIDMDFSNFYSTVANENIVSPVFEIKNYGYHISCFMSESKYVFVDGNNNKIGSVSRLSDIAKIKITIDNDNSLGRISIFNSDISFALDNTNRAPSFFILLTKEEWLTGDYNLYYPESSISVSYFNLNIRNNPTKVFSDEISCYGFGKNAIIEFSPSVTSGYGYGYGYDYGYDYGYGYGETSINRILFIAERPKYYFDTDNESISFFRDFDGFLKLKVKNENSFHIVSTDLTKLKRDSVNHIAASWKTNSILGSEMHIFINGEEAPNIVKFGDNSNKIGKLGHVSKEFIQDDLIRLINFEESFVANTVISTDEIEFGNNDKQIGEVFISDAENNSYAGQAFVIYEIKDSRCKVLSLETFEPFIFNTSDSISIRKAPNAKPKTIFSSSKIGIFLDNKETGIYLYDSSDMNLIDSDDISVSKAFIDQKTNIVYFVKKEDGLFYDGISKESAYITNYGLFSEQISSSLFFKSNSAKTYSYGSEFEVVSSFTTDLPDPLSISEVSIRKIIQERTSPEYSSFVSGSEILSSGSKTINSESSTGDDKDIKFIFESDNLASNSICEITIEGTSNGFLESEILSISKNGEYALNKSFSNISRISFNCSVKYPDVEPFVFSIEESQDIFDSSDCFLYKFSNGEFFISSEQSYYSPKTLSSGLYSFSYRSKMDIKNVSSAKKLFIGSNNEGKFQCKSFMEEFKISENISGQTRPNSFDFDNFTDISSEYMSPIPTCPDNSTLMLVPLTDPSETQVVKLKNIEFLDNNSNSKYSFSKDQVEELYPLMNSEEEFTKKVSEYGFDTETSRKIFYEVHKYNNMPFLDISTNYRYKNDFVYKSYNGPSSDFSGSGIIKGNGVILNDKNIFDKNQFTIEGWFSFGFDTLNNKNVTTLFEATNVVRLEIESSDFNTFVLPNEAREVVSVRLRDSGKISSFNDKIYFDNITGRYVGSSGIEKKLSGRLLSDGVTYKLNENLPGKNVPLEVFYYRKTSGSESLRLYLDSSSNIRLASNYGSKKYEISQFVDFSKNSWNKFSIVYSEKTIRLIINGKEVGYSSNISMSSVPVLFSVGCRYDNSEKSETRFSNIYVSKIAKPYKKDIDGKLKDIQFISKIPTYKDEYTSYSLEFDDTKFRYADFAEVTDQINSMFRFEVDIYDNFGIINNNELQKLLNKLINNVKPAHVKSIVRYKNNRC